MSSLSHPSVEHIFEGHTHMVSSVSFSPDGKMICSGSYDTSVSLWDCEEKRKIKQFNEPEKCVMDVSFSPNQKLIACGGDDNVIRLWNFENSESSSLKDNSHYIKNVQFSFDGENLLSGSWDNTIKLYDITSHRNIRGLKTIKDCHQNTKNFDKGVNCSIFFPNSKEKIVSCGFGGSVKIWDFRTHNCVQKFDFHDNPKTRFLHVYSVDVFDNFIISGSSDRTLNVYDIRKNELLKRFEDFQRDVRSVQFHPNGKYFISGSDDMTTKIFDVVSMKKAFTLDGHHSPVFSVRFSPDGNYFVCGDSAKRVIYWKAKFSPPVQHRPQEEVIEEMKIEMEKKMNEELEKFKMEERLSYQKKLEEERKLMQKFREEYDKKMAGVEKNKQQELEDLYQHMSQEQNAKIARERDEFSTERSKMESEHQQKLMKQSMEFTQSLEQLALKRGTQEAT